MRRHKATLFGSLAVLATAAGCIHEPAIYDPGDMGEGRAPEAPPPVSTYPMPPTDPKGNVYVMSLGPERLATGQGAQNLFLHVRVAVENNSDDTPWQVDPNDELAGFGNGAAVPPSFAEASTGGPVLNVARGARGHLDLYYPLAPQGEPPRVALSWRVHRGPEAVAQTTSFERTVPAEGGGYPYYRPYGADVRLAVGVDWWWWPWGSWGWGGGWGWPWGYRPFFGYPFFPRYSYGYRGAYGGYRGGYVAPRGGYVAPRGGYVAPRGSYGGGGRWVAPPVSGGAWRAPAAPAPAPRGGSYGGSSGAAGRTWHGGRR
jgi:hypothetical protein